MSHLIKSRILAAIFFMAVFMSFLMQTGRQNAEAGPIEFLLDGHLKYFPFEYHYPPYRYRRRAIFPRYERYEERWGYGRRAYGSCHSGRTLRKVLLGRTLKGRSLVSGGDWRAAFYRGGRVRYTYSSGTRKWASWRIQNGSVLIVFPNGYRASKKICRRDGRLQWVNAGSGRASSLITGSYRHRALAGGEGYGRKLVSSRGFETGFVKRTARPVRKEKLLRKKKVGHRSRAVKQRQKTLNRARKNTKAATRRSSGAVSRQHPVSPLSSEKAVTPSYLPPAQKRFTPEKARPRSQNDSRSSLPEADGYGQRKATYFAPKKRKNGVSAHDKGGATRTKVRVAKHSDDKFQRRIPAKKPAIEMPADKVEAGRKGDSSTVLGVDGNAVSRSIDSFFDLLKKPRIVTPSSAGNLEETTSSHAKKQPPKQPGGMPNLKKQNGGLMEIMDKRREKPVSPSSQKLVRLVPQKIGKTDPALPPKNLKGVSGRLILGTVKSGWGAVAYLPSGQFVVATQQKNVSQARRQAADALRKVTQKPHRMVTISNIQCAAIAQDKESRASSVIFVNRGVSLETARQTSLRRCRLSAGGRRSNCQIRYWFCADGRMSAEKL